MITMVISVVNTFKAFGIFLAHIEIKNLLLLLLLFLLFCELSHSISAFQLLFLEAKSSESSWEQPLCHSNFYDVFFYTPLFFILKMLHIYLRERVREHKQREQQRERE